MDKTWAEVNVFQLRNEEVTCLTEKHSGKEVMADNFWLTSFSAPLSPESFATISCTLITTDKHPVIELHSEINLVSHVF